MTEDERVNVVTGAWKDMVNDQSQTIQNILLGADWPPALAKATVDEFYYSLGLRDGSTICFRSATPGCGAGWVILKQITTVHGPMADASDNCDDVSWQRGLEVRVADILWAADGGH